MDVSPPNHLLYADISDYQPGFDARAYARSGRKLVMIKAGEAMSAAGAARWATRTNDAHAAGLHVIHYLFAQLGTPAPASLAAYCARIRPEWDRGDHMLIDVEQASGPASAAARWLAAAQRYLVDEQHAPRASAYTDEAYAAEGGKQLLEQADWWVIAAYDGRLLGVRGTPVLPGKARLLAKQYTDGQTGAAPHVTPGIGACDSNILTRAGAKHLGIVGAGLRRRVLPSGVWS